MPPEAEVSYPAARNRSKQMTETINNDRPPVAKPVSRPRSRRPATVSASALALYLD
jgi:hypothetical protein